MRRIDMLKWQHAKLMRWAISLSALVAFAVASGAGARWV
jgi:hypothetical protein